MNEQHYKKSFSLRYNWQKKEQRDKGHLKDSKILLHLNFVLNISFDISKLKMAVVLKPTEKQNDDSYLTTPGVGAVCVCDQCNLKGPEQCEGPETAKIRHLEKSTTEVIMNGTM